MQFVEAVKMRVGSWVECENNYSHRSVKVMFFRKIDYPHLYCQLCLDAIRLRDEKRYGSSTNINTQSYINHLTESKPEKDTL